MLKRMIIQNTPRIVFVALSFLTLPAWGTDLLVGNISDNSIKRYDGLTGAFLGNFIPSGSGGLNGPTFFTFGPDGNLYVSSFYTNSVKRYNGTTGAYLGDFAVTAPGVYGVVFGNDGNLYVATADWAPGHGKVAKYNGATGAYIDDFVPNDGRAHYYQGMTFGPDGNLYVADIGDPSDTAVRRYNGSTGASMGNFVGNLGPSNPVAVKFGPDGNAYVAFFYGQAIKRYNGVTGALLGSFSAPFPADLALGPDGDLYVSSRYSGAVLRFDSNTNALLGTFAAGPSNIFGLQWFPTPAYKLCLLYDPGKGVHAGADIPIKLQLCDANGRDLSAPAIILHASGITQLANSIVRPVQDQGRSNPGDDFRFDITLGAGGGYLFNLSTDGLPAGSYTLNFHAGSDPTIYRAPFTVK